MHSICGLMCDGMWSYCSDDALTMRECAVQCNVMRGLCADLICPPFVMSDSISVIDGRCCAASSSCHMLFTGNGTICAPWR